MPDAVIRGGAGAAQLADVVGPWERCCWRHCTARAGGFEAELCAPKPGGELLALCSAGHVVSDRGWIQYLGLLRLCCRCCSGCAPGLHGFAPELFSKEARSTGCLRLFLCWWEEARRSSSLFSCKTSSRLPFCEPRVSRVFSVGDNSCSCGNAIWMQQSVDALSVWMCWSWESRVRAAVGCGLMFGSMRCRSVHHFQHQACFSSSSLEIRRPGLGTCRQGKEKCSTAASAHVQNGK